jgi:hypothetical protein
MCQFEFIDTGICAPCDSWRAEESLRSFSFGWTLVFSRVVAVVLFTGAAGMSDCILRRIVGHRFSYTRFSIRDGRIVLSYLVDAKQARLIKIRRYHA